MINQYGSRIHVKLQDVINANGLFFSRETMRFFGQSRRMFTFKTTKTGKAYIYAPSYWDGKLMGYTFRQVNPDLTLTAPKDHFYTLSEVLDYIERNK